MGSIDNTATIPIVNLSSSNPEAPRQLLAAAAEYGFVYIENNEAGIPKGDIAQMFDLSRQFFAAPSEEKESVSIKSNNAGKNHGWLSQGVEMLDPATQKRPDVKEAFNIGEPVNGEYEQPMPTTLQQHIGTIKAFQRACNELCQRINEAFAVALGIDRNWFTSRHSRPNAQSSSVFRMLYYPGSRDYEHGVDIRAGAHSDYGSITLLFQQLGQPGLEIQKPDGSWAPVPVDPHQNVDGNSNIPILVNIGDLLEDWTGGLLRSTVHRVVFPTDGSQEDRYSMAYFCHPLDDALLEPVPCDLVAEHARRTGKTGMRDGKLINAADHLRARLAATYNVG